MKTFKISLCFFSLFSVPGAVFFVEAPATTDPHQHIEYMLEKNSIDLPGDFAPRHVISSTSFVASPDIESPVAEEVANETSDKNEQKFSQDLDFEHGTPLSEEELEQAFSDPQFQNFLASFSDALDDESFDPFGDYSDGSEEMFE